MTGTICLTRIGIGTERRRVRETHHIMAAIAVGRKGDAAQLSDDLRQMETPNSRKPLSQVASRTYPLADG